MTSQQIKETSKRAASKIALNYGFTEHGSAAFAYLIASEFLPFSEGNPSEQLLFLTRELVLSDEAMRNCGIDDFPRMMERADHAMQELRRYLSVKRDPLEIKQTCVPLNKV